jgi:hypothetical protein
VSTEWTKQKRWAPAQSTSPHLPVGILFLENVEGGTARPVEDMTGTRAVPRCLCCASKGFGGRPWHSPGETWHLQKCHGAGHHRRCGALSGVSPLPSSDLRRVQTPGSSAYDDILTFCITTGASAGNLGHEVRTFLPTYICIPFCRRDAAPRYAGLHYLCSMNTSKCQGRGSTSPLHKSDSETTSQYVGILASPIYDAYWSQNQPSQHQTPRGSAPRRLMCNHDRVTDPSPSVLP